MLIPFENLFRKYNIQSTQALHLGANTGQEAEEYYRLGFSFVLWIEAHGPTFQKLKHHLFGFPGQHAVQACVSDKDGEEVVFNVANNGCQSSSILDFGTHSKEHPTVKFIENIKLRTCRVDTLLSQLGLGFESGSFLNIDLQGAELMALKGIGDSILSAFDHIYVEVNQRELYRGCPLVKDIDGFLGQRGFKGMECHMTGSGWGDKYYKRI